MAGQQQQSSLARAHPDHPTLAQLNTSTDVSKSPESNSTSISSPPQVVNTPSSISPSGSPVIEHTPMKRPGGLSDSPNARSKSVSIADGQDTFGVLNRHPAVNLAAGSTTPASGNGANTVEAEATPTNVTPSQEEPTRSSFRVGVSEDRNKRCRRTMEDAHSFIYDYAGVRGQGYFAVFDGHAGKHAAEWCGQNFHEYLLDGLVDYPNEPIPDVLNKVFHAVDRRLSHLAYRTKQHSGCTAVTAFLRIEQNTDAVNCGFSNPAIQTRGLMEGKGEEDLEAQTSGQAMLRRASMGAGSSGAIGGAATPEHSLRRKLSGRRIRDFVRGLTSSGARESDSAIEDDLPEAPRIESIDPKCPSGIRRVLYTANVGDARAVLCRAGQAVRLTYDHKGSDSQEAKRITDAGGFVLNNRVNGVLAVTRSLGDASMKEFVVGSPYTTETELDDDDEFLIVACDGLWDVCDDQDAVDLIRDLQDPQEASKRLLEHAMSNYSTDNLSIMVIRLYSK